MPPETGKHATGKGYLAFFIQYTSLMDSCQYDTKNFSLIRVKTGSNQPITVN